MKSFCYWLTQVLLGDLQYILIYCLPSKAHFRKQQNAFPHALLFFNDISMWTVLCLCSHSPTCVNSDFNLGWMVESTNSDYLKKSFPWDLLIALHRISKIILKWPEFSIQVIIYWDGTGRGGGGRKKKYWKPYIKFKSTQEFAIP